MGQMRFSVPRPERIDPLVLQRTYLAGMDSVPWLSSSDWDGETLTVSREIRESGNLYIPWAVAEHGELMLTTASLMERRATYHLPVELARGTLNRLRNQAAVWQQSGMVISSELTDQIRHAGRTFSRAATHQSDPLVASDLAEESLRLALHAIRKLATEYAQQVIAYRTQQSPQIPTLLVGNMESEPFDPAMSRRFLRAFNSAAVPVSWRLAETEQGRIDLTKVEQQVQWCRDQNLRVIVGPLASLERSNLPDWMYLWEGDYEMIQPCVTKLVHAAVERLRGKVQVWNVAARLNIGDTLQLTEEHRLRMAVDAIETVRRLDSKTPIIITVDQPWGEYLAHENFELSPLHFADTLVRAELGIAGLGLELNFDYWPRGSTHRDLLEINRLMDNWSQFALPLVVFLTAPSSDDVDPEAAAGIKAVPAARADRHSRETQADFVESVVPLLLAKPNVHAIVWNQMRDDQRHDFPYGGLFDFRHKKKKAIRSLSAIRRRHLN
jgi:hypothetical protein